MTEAITDSIHPLHFAPFTLRFQDKVVESGIFSSSQAAEEHLDRILEPYPRESQGLLEYLGTAVARTGTKIPWAILFLPRSLPLTGHFLSVRQSPAQLSLNFYDSWSGRPEDYAEVSTLIIWEKSGLKELAEHCPFLSGAWEALSYIPETWHFMLFAPEPDPSWLETKADSDRTIFDLLRSAEQITNIDQGNN